MGGGGLGLGTTGWKHCGNTATRSIMCAFITCTTRPGSLPPAQVVVMAPFGKQVLHRRGAAGRRCMGQAASHAAHQRLIMQQAACHASSSSSP